MGALREALRRWLIPELPELVAAQARSLSTERERALREHLRGAVSPPISSERAPE